MIVSPDGTSVGAVASAAGVRISAEIPIDAVTGPSGSIVPSRCLMIIGPAA